MAIFLTGAELSKKIQDICQSDNVRCIVAFWGDGAKEYLFGDSVPKGTKIICDLSMGATNPTELRGMGAPDPSKIRHVQGMHSKVYISDIGVVVSSANASKNALSFGTNGQGHLEAGVFHGENTEVFKKCKDWFSGIWKSAKPVTEADLKSAETEWNSRKWARNIAHPAPDLRKTTLFQMVVKQPEAFNGIDFLFSNALADRETVQAGLEIMNGEEPSPIEVNNAMKGAFDGWELSFENWPERFICVYRSRKNKITLGAYYRGKVIDEPDIHFASSAKWLAFLELKNIRRGNSEAEANDFVAKNNDFCDFDGEILDAYTLQERLNKCGF